MPVRKKSKQGLGVRSKLVKASQGLFLSTRLLSLDFITLRIRSALIPEDAGDLFPSFRETEES